jgi:CubicO group peptidase (beta-lactamase class C family)
VINHSAEAISKDGKKVIELSGASVVIQNTIQNQGASGKSLNVTKLDSLFNSFATRDLAMGSLTISKNGIVQYQKAIGYSFKENEKIQANIDTKYRIGSISKLFTAVMIFQLIEEGKINLNQKLNVYYPNLPNADKITIRNMLYHRSGLHDYTKDTDFPEWMDKFKTHDDLLTIIIEKGTDFEPDAKADYCSSNYLLLGYIIERVCKTTYGNALQKRITSKMGLQNTYYGSSINISKNESASYKYADNAWKAYMVVQAQLCLLQQIWLSL